MSDDKTDKNDNTETNNLLKKLILAVDSGGRNLSYKGDTLAKGVMDTGAGFVGGPFGDLINEKIQNAYVKQIDKIKNKRVGEIKVTNEKGEEVKGQAHKGMKSIPKEGTYNLDKGERVISAQENKDLQRTMNRVKAVESKLSSGNPFRFSGGGTASLLTDIAENTATLKDEEPIITTFPNKQSPLASVIDNEDRIYNEGDRRERRHHQETLKRLTSIREAVTGQTEESSNRWADWSLRWNNYTRRPLWNLYQTIKGLISTTSRVGNSIFGISRLFDNGKFFGGIGNSIRAVYKSIYGDNKNDTERIVESNEEITSAVEGRSRLGKTGGWLSDGVVGAILGTGLRGVKRADIAEQKRAKYGEDSLTKREQRDLDAYGDYVEKRVGDRSFASSKLTVSKLKDIHTELFKVRLAIIATGSNEEKNKFLIGKEIRKFRKSRHDSIQRGKDSFSSVNGS